MSASGVTAPKGFRASGVAVAIKPTSKKRDCGLIVSDVPATVAGVFTRNLVKSATVVWSDGVCRDGVARGVFVNSGNANACTGAQGLADAEATAARVAGKLGVDTREICICSTGVIGVPLPMDRIAAGVDRCIDALSRDGGADVAEAIMTTDTVPKEVAVQVELPDGTVTIGGIAKGAGMLAPNVATMLVFLTTDAAISREDLLAALRLAADKSFNCICVDNDSSTNDTVLCLANGQSGTAPLKEGTDGYRAFSDALTGLCQNQAKQLVRDGEGVTKFVTVEVTGAATDADAKTIARAVAHSQLCKTAFFGNDANWGRIACAAGYSGARFDPDRLSIWMDDVCVMASGRRTDYLESDAAACVARNEFTIRIDVGAGSGQAEFWTSDLSLDYVRINAEYRT